jgi:hypothetical protein
MLALFINADIGTPIAAEYCKPSFKEILTDTLDTPINNTNNSSMLDNITNVSVNNSIDDDVVMQRILKFNPNATMGEVIACNMMMGEQLNSTKNGLNLSIYTAYLNNSTEYPIPGVDLTARQLYDQAPAVKAFVNGLDSVLVRYSHMSKEEKVEFLLTKTPCDALTNTILDNSGADELGLLSKKAFTAFDNFPTYTSKTVDIAKAQDFQEKTEKRIDNFNHDVLYYDKYFQVYGNDLPTSVDNFDDKKSNSVKTLDKAIYTMGNIRTQFVTAGSIIMVVAVLLIMIGSALLGLPGMNMILAIISSVVSPAASAALCLILLKIPGNEYPYPYGAGFAIGQIIGAIMIGIGMGLLALAIYLIVFAEVTIKNLQDRVIIVRDDMKKLERG